MFDVKNDLSEIITSTSANDKIFFFLWYRLNSIIFLLIKSRPNVWIIWKHCEFLEYMKVNEHIKNYYSKWLKEKKETNPLSLRKNKIKTMNTKSPHRF